MPPGVASSAPATLPSARKNTKNGCRRNSAPPDARRIATGAVVALAAPPCSSSEARISCTNARAAHVSEQRQPPQSQHRH